MTLTYTCQRNGQRNNEIIILKNAWRGVGAEYVKCF